MSKVFYNKYTLIIIFVLFTLGLFIFIRYNFSRIDFFQSQELNYNITNDNSYLINLDRRKDRLDVTIPKLTEFGFYPVNRFSGIDSSKFTEEEIRRYVKPSSMESILKNYRTLDCQLSKGAVGCYLSHCYLWGKMINEKLSYLYIFEDDTLPTYNKSKLDKYISQVPDDFDIILFGGYYKQGNHICENVFKIKDFWGMHGYLIKNTRRIQEALEKALPMTVQIDSYLSELAKQDKINIYGISHDQMWLQNSDINMTDVQIQLIKN